jgi:HlyD family secretion protein
MKKWRIIGVIIIVLLVAAGIWLFALRKKEDQPVFVTVTPEYGYISTSVTATGTVEPVDTVAVGTQVSGTIDKVLVDFNSVVKKGELLAQIDQSLFIAQVEQITANLQSAQSNLVYQQANFNRQSSLYKAGAISQADYETAEYQYKSAEDNVSNLKAQLKSAQKNLSFTNIYSPINGTVLSRNVSEGQTVAASFNTPTLFSIAQDLTKMQVQAAVDEADIGNVKPGERATFTVDAFPNDVFNGTIKTIRLDPTVSANVVTYTTIINAPNEQLKLKPGMTANIIIYTQEINNALLIPASAVNFEPDSALKNIVIIRAVYSKGSNKENTNTSNTSTNNNQKLSTASGKIKNDSVSYKKEFVWIKRGDTLLEKRIITGIDDDVHIQVIKGLTNHDQIVTGMMTEAAAKSAAQSSERSPFMPHRPQQKTNQGGTKTTH